MEQANRTLAFSFFWKTEGVQAADRPSGAPGRTLGGRVQLQSAEPVGGADGARTAAWQRGRNGREPADERDADADSAAVPHPGRRRRRRQERPALGPDHLVPPAGAAPAAGCAAQMNETDLDDPPLRLYPLSLCPAVFFINERKKTAGLIPSCTQSVTRWRLRLE